MMGGMKKSLLIITYVMAIAALHAWGGPPPDDSHPNDENMTSVFRLKKSSFEELRGMAASDRHLVRIAIDFTRLENDWSWPRPPEKIGLTPERWERYRELFRETGIWAGIDKAADPDTIFFVASANGLVTGGSQKGYVFSTAALSPVSSSLDGPIDYKTSRLRFKTLGDGWYLYYSWDD